MIKKAKYATLRSGFTVYYAAYLATGGVLLYLLAPLTTYLYFHDWRFWRHIGEFPKVLSSSYRMLWRYFFEKEYRRVCDLPFLQAPRLKPDLNKVGLAKDWNHGLQDCAGCVNCCIIIGCPFVDHEIGGCRCYGSFFWRYFNCGRFPVQSNQLKYYGCKKWSFEETTTR